VVLKREIEVIAWKIRYRHENNIKMEVKEIVCGEFLDFVTFQLPMVASTKFRVFWDVAPCSHIEVDRRFRGA
jgi:hypothetical protein